MKILHFSVKSSFRIRKNSKSRILPELMTKNHSFSRVSRMSRAAPRAVSKGASVESSIFKSLSEPAKQFMDRERLTALVSTPPSFVSSPLRTIMEGFRRATATASAVPMLSQTSLAMIFAALSYFAHSTNFASENSSRLSSVSTPLLRASRILRRIPVSPG